MHQICSYPKDSINSVLGKNLFRKKEVFCLSLNLLFFLCEQVLFHRKIHKLLLFLMKKYYFCQCFAAILTIVLYLTSDFQQNNLPTIKKLYFKIIKSNLFEKKRNALFLLCSLANFFISQYEKLFLESPK